MFIPTGSGIPIYRTRMRGIGETAGQIGVQVGTSAAGAGALVGLGLTSALAGAVTFGIGAVAIAVMALRSRRGPAQKVATTNIVNQVAPLMQQNLDAWNASAKSCADQAAALKIFDALWGEVVANCAQPSLGDPGHSCLDDRLPAGVQFEYNSFHINGNGMYDWFSYYRTPIANDPAAQGCCPVGPSYYPGASVPASNCVPAGSAGSVNIPGVGSISASALLIPAALLALLWAVS